MLIKVDYKGLNKLEEESKKNSDSLDHEIDVLLKALDELKTIWQGEDSDIFYNNAHDYFSRMKILPAFQESMVNFIKDSRNQYEDNDKEFSEKLKREKDEIEKDRDFRFKQV